MHNRPDRPLVVKCTFDRWNKRITFSSARNCTYDLLRHKVEQCFSLYATSYAIAYKDDDGEVTDITTDTDLTEAIQYFQAGSDDPPLSSTASILSGRSFGSRKITLRVHISVDYDGPSLSDTSSLVSLDEYKGRNGSQLSFSFTSPSVDVDDDSVTVSSREAGGLSRAGHHSSGLSERVESIHSSTTSSFDRIEAVPHLGSEASWELESLRDSNSQDAIITVPSPQSSSNPTTRTQRGENPFLDEHVFATAQRYPEDPEAVFERLRLSETARDGGSSVDFESLSANDRGAAWLRDQNERTIRSMLGALPEPSEPDDASIALNTYEESLQDHSSAMGGDLALRRDPRGKYYYSYTSVGSSGASQSNDYSGDEVLVDASVTGEGRTRPTSMQLNWLASQHIPTKIDGRIRASTSLSSSRRSVLISHKSDPLPTARDHSSMYPDIPAEVLQFLPLTSPPEDELTDCSECGVLLDSIRYVCSSCGEKSPIGSRVENRKGKSSSLGESSNMTYPPPRHRTFTPSPPMSSSSQTYIGDPDYNINRHKPLPSLPSLGQGSRAESGYELCSGCIESAGVNHAIEVGLASGSSPGIGNSSPSSPEDAQRALSQWRRSAPKQKGQLRHAYREKAWGHSGWADVEQDESVTRKCSTCHAVNIGKRYKCASCSNTNLCLACYGQVHDLHPSHAFLVVPDVPVRSRSEPDYFPSIPPDPNDEQSMKHPGVKCAHCMLDILGARFHCAVCQDVDICSNCESAGLPGNLDSSDGGHNSSHIMIKIPYPLETNEIQTASRRAIHLWTGRDAANVGLTAPKSKPSSVVSSYARTIVGSGSRNEHSLGQRDDHHLLCNGCGQSIIGTRYQCGNCPSLPTSYSLCAGCEERSYIIHNPMHAFFKIPRPVQRPLESPYPFLPKLYKVPVGPLPTSNHFADPKAYLKTLNHKIALCDRCMNPSGIQGEWFRCAYCAKDLCDTCQSLDTHDDTHIFLVFKSEVDIQLFRHFADIENPDGSPPIIRYPVYR